MPYAPAVPPSDPSSLPDYVYTELGKVGNELEGIWQLEVRHVPPDKPRDGMLVFADGTDWNPGAGRGVYVYDGGWVKL